MSLLDDIRARIVPDHDEQARIEGLAQRLIQAVQDAAQVAGIQGQATIQGSIAKGTWLAGATDVDLFFLVPVGTPQEQLDGLAGTLADQVLKDPKRKYAQHPYIVGEFEGLQVDLVPAYAVQAAGAKMSAVDRTPFHTAWVLDTIDAPLRDEVRLAKQWLKGIGAYGAQTDVGGFSGYLVEVLIHIHGGFGPFLEWLQAGATPARLSTRDDQVTEEAPLVVVDPVDPARNVAAAVTQDTLDLAIEGAQAYLASPEATFFFPRPPRAESSEVLQGRLEAMDAQWLGVEMQAKTDRLDIVYPQFQKTARQWQAAMEREGFQVLAIGDHTQGDLVGLQFLVRRPTLPRIVIHEGPPAKAIQHADRFRAKWQDHPERLEDIETGPQGRLVVRLKPAIQTPEDALRHATGLTSGKHVQAALTDARILSDPSDVLPLWSPHVSDFILDRRPWQR